MTIPDGRSQSLIIYIVKNYDEQTPHLKRHFFTNITQDVFLPYSDSVVC